MSENLIMCFNCNKQTGRIRLERFTKKYKDEYINIKIFECQGCRHHTCSIEASDWKPKDD